jgi:UDPglucose 6-dehydrogenase
VRASLESIVDCVRPGTLVLVSSQVPAGFTGGLERAWQGKGLRYACSPENLRLGKALACFRTPERVVVGLRDEADRATLTALFAPFCQRIEWMSIESAEMTKHALNAFLATSVTFINELARLCEVVGADAREVERGLKSEARIGPGAYLSPGAAYAGGTLARDVRFLAESGAHHQVSTPLMLGVRASNEEHKGWMRQQVERLLQADGSSVVAILGLTYKPGTDTLRRSQAIELCSYLQGRGVRVRAHDPVVRQLPEHLGQQVQLCTSTEEALRGADVVVLATPWPVYRSLAGNDLVRCMRRAQVIDPGHFLGQELAKDPRVTYVAPGRVRAA